MSETEKDSLDPIDFSHSWNHDDPDDKKGWKDAVLKEFSDMESREVWMEIDVSDIPENKKGIGTPTEPGDRPGPAGQPDGLAGLEMQKCERGALGKLGADSEREQGYMVGHGAPEDFHIYVRTPSC